LKNIKKRITNEFCLYEEFTPKELLRLQDFPDNFKYEENAIIKQIGNAVNVKVVQKCANFLILNELLF
jgi:site-specific DNA-cytosine methylase